MYYVFYTSSAWDADFVVTKHVMTVITHLYDSWNWPFCPGDSSCISQQREIKLLPLDRVILFLRTSCIGLVSFCYVMRPRFASRGCTRCALLTAFSSVSSTLGVFNYFSFLRRILHRHKKWNHMKKQMLAYNAWLSLVEILWKPLKKWVIIL